MLTRHCTRTQSHTGCAPIVPTRPAASQTLNVVRYTKGQEFKSHLDASSEHSARHE